MIDDLAEMGPEAVPAIPALIALWNDPDVSIWSHAHSAVCNMGTGAVAHLWRALRDERPRVRGLAISAIAHLHNHDVGIKAAVLAAAVDKNPFVRYQALNGLQIMHLEEDAKLSVLFLALQDTAPIEPLDTQRICDYAAACIGDCRSRSDIIAPRLIQTARLQDLRLRALCVRALGHLRATDNTVTQHLIESFDARNPQDHESAERLRGACVWSLGEIASQPAQVVPFLIKVVSNREMSIELRAEAATALGKFGPAAKVSILTLKEAASETESELRDRAARALELIQRR
jgi:HEAT repeat protein